MPGITCITPRALAEETIALLKPLSCHAIAAASEGETPYCAATACTSAAPRRVAVGAGSACGTTGAGAGSSARTGTGAPPGSLITVPETSRPSGSSPFIAAMSDIETPAPAASAESVSPGRTVYPPWTCGAAPPLDAAGADPPPPATDRELPAISSPVGSSPFAAATASTDVPLAAAIPDSVSPGWTT